MQLFFILCLLPCIASISSSQTQSPDIARKLDESRARFVLLMGTISDDSGRERDMVLKLMSPISLCYSNGSHDGLADLMKGLVMHLLHFRHGRPMKVIDTSIISQKPWAGEIDRFMRDSANHDAYRLVVGVFMDMLTTTEEFVNELSEGLLRGAALPHMESHSV